MALLPEIKRERGRSELARFRNEMDNLFHGFFEDWDRPIWKHVHWRAIPLCGKATGI